MNDRIDVAKVGAKTTRLTLAVELVDGFTGRRPLADLRVRATNAGAAPVRNPSGYYLFVNLPDDPLTVVVEGGDRYLDREATIDPTAHDPPAVSLDVAPSPAYRFPSGATLLRGSVVDGVGEPVVSATASISGTETETVTDENGEFVLFFETILPSDVHRDADRRRWIRVDAADPELVVAHPDFDSQTVSKPVQEGSTTYYTLALG